MQPTKYNKYNLKKMFIHFIAFFSLDKDWGFSQNVDLLEIIIFFWKIIRKIFYFEKGILKNFRKAILFNIINNVLVTTTITYIDRLLLVLTIKINFKEFEIFPCKKRRFRLRWDSSPGLSVVGKNFKLN